MFLCSLLSRNDILDNNDVLTRSTSTGQGETGVKAGSPVKKRLGFKCRSEDRFDYFVNFLDVFEFYPRLFDHYMMTGEP